MEPTPTFGAPAAESSTFPLHAIRYRPITGPEDLPELKVLHDASFPLVYEEAFYQWCLTKNCLSVLAVVDSCNDILDPQQQQLRSADEQQQQQQQQQGPAVEGRVHVRDGAEEAVPLVAPKSGSSDDSRQSTMTTSTSTTGSHCSPTTGPSTDASLVSFATAAAPAVPPRRKERIIGFVVGRLKLVQKQINPGLFTPNGGMAPVAYIATFGVVPEYRGQGVGNQLLDRLLAIFESKGIVKTVSSSSLAAVGALGGSDEALDGDISVASAVESAGSPSPAQQQQAVERSSASPPSSSVLMASSSGVTTTSAGRGMKHGSSSSLSGMGSSSSTSSSGPLAHGVGSSHQSTGALGSGSTGKSAKHSKKDKKDKALSSSPSTAKPHSKTLPKTQTRFLPLCDEVYLHCLATNHTALDFYRKRGFMLVDYLKDYYMFNNAKHSAVVLRAPLHKGRAASPSPSTTNSTSSSNRSQRKTSAGGSPATAVAKGGEDLGGMREELTTHPHHHQERCLSPVGSSTFFDPVLSEAASLNQQQNSASSIRTPGVFLEDAEPLEQEDIEPYCLAKVNGMGSWSSLSSLGVICRFVLLIVGAVAAIAFVSTRM